MVMDVLRFNYFSVYGDLFHNFSVQDSASGNTFVEISVHLLVCNISYRLLKMEILVRFCISKELSGDPCSAGLWTVV